MEVFPWVLMLLHCVPNDSGCLVSIKVTPREDKMSSGVLIVITAMTVAANTSPHKSESSFQCQV